MEHLYIYTARCVETNENIELCPAYVRMFVLACKPFFFVHVLYAQEFLAFASRQFASIIVDLSVSFPRILFSSW